MLLKKIFSCAINTIVKVAKTHPKNTFSVIILLIRSLWLKTELDSTEYFIQPVNVSESISKSLASPITLADNSLAKIRQINTDFKNNDVDAINKFRIKNNLEVTSCQNLIPTLDSCNCLLDLINEIKAKTTDGDIKIKTTTNFKLPINFSIDDTWGYLKEHIGKPTIYLKTEVVPKNNKGLITVNATYDSEHSYHSDIVANNNDKIEDKIAILHLRYTSPATFASLMHAADPYGTSQAIQIAVMHNSEYKKISSPFTLLGNLNLKNSEQLQDFSYIKDAQSNFEKALEINNNDENAKLGLVIVHRINAELDLIKPSNNLALADEQQLNSMIGKGLLVSQAYRQKITFYDNVAAENIIKGAINKYPNEQSLKLTYISLLLQDTSLDTAESYVESLSKDHEVGQNSYADLPSYIKLGNLILLLNQYNRLSSDGNELENKLREINSQSSKLNSCEFNSWLSYVSNYINIFALKPDKTKSDNKKYNMLLNSTANQLAIAERNGTYGFQFHFINAQILHELDMSNEAVKQYEKSLYYPGAHYKSKANLSEIQLDIGDYYRNLKNEYKAINPYKKSEEYATESIKLNKTPEAVGNFLSAIFSLKDYKRYISEFKLEDSYLRENLVLSNDNEAYNSMLTQYGYAICSIGNLDDAKKIYEFTIKNTLLYSKTVVDLQECIKNAH